MPGVRAVLLWNEKARAVVNPLLLEGDVVPAHVCFVPRCPTRRAKEQLPRGEFLVAHGADDLVFDPLLIVGGEPYAAVMVHRERDVRPPQARTKFAAATAVQEPK